MNVQFLKISNKVLTKQNVMLKLNTEIHVQFTKTFL